MTKALILIDIQESFRHRPYWDASDVPVFLEKTQRLIDACTRAHVPVVQVFHVETEGEANNPFAPDSGYVKTMQGLKVAPDAVFRKSVHSALYGRDEQGTRLDDWLRARNIQTLVITGIRTEQCCETTTRHASDAGFKVRFAIDATLTFPMQSPSGKHYTAADICDRTHMVLQDRFAQVVPAEEALSG